MVLTAECLTLKYRLLAVLVAPVLAERRERRERREQAEAQVAEVAAVKVALPDQAAMALQELRLLVVQVVAVLKAPVQSSLPLELQMVVLAALGLMVVRMVVAAVAAVNPAALGRSKALIHPLLETQALQA